jgi:serine/threonine protein kinase
MYPAVTQELMDKHLWQRLVAKQKLTACPSAHWPSIGSDPWYCVQQVLRGTRVEGCQAQAAGRAADVYACGVHLYKMLFLRYPFDGDNATSMSQNIVNGNIVKPNHAVHKEVWDLLEKMLDSEWETRISIDDIMRHRVYLENLPSEVAVCSLLVCELLGTCTAFYPQP